MDPTLYPSWFNPYTLNYPTAQPDQLNWPSPWSFLYGAPVPDQTQPPQQQRGRTPQSQMQRFGQMGLNMLKPQTAQMPYGMAPPVDAESVFPLKAGITVGEEQRPSDVPAWAT